ncbi:hypothetical protein Trydic_g23384 [Trypoxylus dichotomus]
MKTLVSKSQRLTDDDHLRAKSSEIKHILRTIGFPTINRAFHAKTKPMDTITYATKAYLLCIKVTEKLDEF